MIWLQEIRTLVCKNQMKLPTIFGIQSFLAMTGHKITVNSPFTRRINLYSIFWPSYFWKRISVIYNAPQHNVRVFLSNRQHTMFQFCISWLCYYRFIRWHWNEIWNIVTVKLLLPITSNWIHLMTVCWCSKSTLHLYLPASSDFTLFILKPATLPDVMKDCLELVSNLEFFQCFGFRERSTLSYLNYSCKFWYQKILTN